MNTGLDSAYPPSPVEVSVAKHQGYSWWGYYINGIDGDEDPLNTWTPGQVAVVRDGGIAPMGIWVPSPNLASDPVDAANESFKAAGLAGQKITTAILYDGPHLINTGQIVGPVWLPIPGYSGAVGPLSAIQNGSGHIGQTSVDTNISAPDFPAATGLVVDLEHAVLDNTSLQHAVDWYHAFQHQISVLTQSQGVKPPPMNLLPASAKPIKSVEARWAGPDTTDPKNELDVWYLGADGLSYHYWLHPGSAFEGPESVGF